MTAETAKTVLQNGTLRWSSPTLFNDPFDVQFDLHIEYDRGRVAERIIQEIVDGYAGRAPIIVGNQLGALLAFMHEKAPGISEAELRQTLMPGIYEGMEKAEAQLPKTHQEMRAISADLKLLCLSEVFDNILMWAHYSKDHTGVVIELSCLEKFDSAWGAAKPVRYEERMPLLIDDERLFRLMSGQSSIGDQDIFENSVLVKAADWAYEKEWRLVGGWDKAKSVEDVPFNLEEITAVYLGCRASENDVREIKGIVQRKYPHATLQLGRKSDRRFSLEFLEEKIASN
jgi:hypothetical protein